MPSEHPLMKNPLGLCVVSLAGGLIALLLFRLFAEYEIFFSALFFSNVDCADASKVRCGHFPAMASQFWREVRIVGLKLPQVFAGLTAVWLFYIVFFRGDKKPEEIMRPTHGLMSMFIGPFILANVFFKPLWGRPRPSQTLEFNGDAPYVLPGDISDYCVGNCSFISGEATAAFWMFWIVPFLPPRWRKLFAAVIFILASFISLLRVSFGGHFLSDVAVAAFVAFFAIGLSALILQTRLLKQGFQAWCDFSNRHIFGRK